MARVYIAPEVSIIELGPSVELLQGSDSGEDLPYSMGVIVVPRPNDP